MENKFYYKLQKYSPRPGTEEEEYIETYKRISIEEFFKIVDWGRDSGFWDTMLMTMINLKDKCVYRLLSHRKYSEFCEECMKKNLKEGTTDGLELDFETLKDAKFIDKREFEKICLTKYFDGSLNFS